jgi:hypothetical protein
MIISDKIDIDKAERLAAEFAKFIDVDDPHFSYGEVLIACAVTMNATLLAIQEGRQQVARDMLKYFENMISKLPDQMAH